MTTLDLHFSSGHEKFENTWRYGEQQNVTLKLVKIIF